MPTAIIIDDEIKLREVLKMKLNKYCQEVEIIGEAGNISEGISLISNREPDLLFLDISMPGGSGFDMIAQLPDLKSSLIFVTGYDKYALDALKVSAVDYLLKPVKTEELIDAVNKAIKRNDSLVSQNHYNVLQHNLNKIGDQEAKIAIPSAEAYDFIKIAEIIRCEGWNKYTKVFTLDGEVLVSSYNVGVFKDILEEYGFYTTHKSHIINTKYIDKYLRDGTVVMSDKSHVPLARRRKDDFFQKVLSKHIIR